MKSEKTKSDQETIIFGGYRPNQLVDILHFKDKKPYWISGYEIFDPNLVFITTRGMYKKVSEEKKILINKGYIPVVGKGQKGVVIPYHPSLVRLSQPRDSYTFRDVFGF